MVMNLICAFKIVLMMINQDLLLVLNEAFIVENFAEKFWLLCVLIFHLISLYTYYSWGKISRAPEKIGFLYFIFNGDREELIRSYGFSGENYEKFLKRFGQNKFLVISFMVAMDVMLGFFCLRGLNAACWQLHPPTFWSMSFPFCLVTLYSYHHLTFGILTVYLLKFTTQLFLGLRAETIAECVEELGRTLDEIRSFGQELKNIRNSQGPQNPIEVARIENELRVRKNRFLTKAAWVKRSVNDMVDQFEDAREFFDRQLSAMYFTTLLCGLLFPVYFFFPNDTLSMFFIAALYVSGLFLTGFSLTVYNLRFEKYMKVLPRTIYRNVTRLYGTKLNEFLLNFVENSTSKWKKISFTVLFGSFHLNTWDLFEYLAHSLSLIFLIAPLLPKNTPKTVERATDSNKSACGFINNMW